MVITAKTYCCSEHWPFFVGVPRGLRSLRKSLGDSDGRSDRSQRGISAEVSFEQGRFCSIKHP